MVVASPDDLVSAVARDRRMVGYRVRRQGEGWIELEVVAQRARSPVLLVLAWPEVWRDKAALEPHLIRARAGNYGLILVGADEELDETHARRDAARRRSRPRSRRRSRWSGCCSCSATASEAIAMRMAAATIELELERSRHENDMLISIGRALSQERKIEKLLEIILKRACEVTNADAGSVYIVEGHDEAGRGSASCGSPSARTTRATSQPARLHDERQRDVDRRPLRDLSGERINVPDLYKLDEPGSGNNQWGFVHDRTFDDKYRYQTRSVLAVPMISARSEVIGVIQLINKRAKGWIELEGSERLRGRRRVVRRGVGDLRPGARVAGRHRARERPALRGGQDAVRQLREGRGHRDRVARSDDVRSLRARRRAHGRPRQGGQPRRHAAASARSSSPTTTLTQIEYAALLHDFGKVGVREHVLVKAKKLYEHERELILQRFQLIKRGYKIEGLETQGPLPDGGVARPGRWPSSPPSTRRSSERVAELDDIIKFILAVQRADRARAGRVRADRRDRGHDVSRRGRHAAAVPHGRRGELPADQARLADRARSASRSTATSSTRTTSSCQIPWSRTLRDVPEIAGAHHEKLDGTGYPHRLRGEQIPVPARMMAISDIYDALTASDRPYKKAMPAEKALDILAVRRQARAARPGSVRRVRRRARVGADDSQRRALMSLDLAIDPGVALPAGAARAASAARSRAWSRPPRSPRAAATSTSRCGSPTTRRSTCSTATGAARTSRPTCSRSRSARPPRADAGAARRHRDLASTPRAARPSAACYAELLHLASHGLCHLLGYDHRDDAEEREMNTRAAALRREGAPNRPRARRLTRLS